MSDIVLGVIIALIIAMTLGILYWLLSEGDDEYEDYLRNRKGWYK